MLKFRCPPSPMVGAARSAIKNEVAAADSGLSPTTSTAESSLSERDSSLTDALHVTHLDADLLSHQWTPQPSDRPKEQRCRPYPRCGSPPSPPLPATTCGTTTTKHSELYLRTGRLDYYAGRRGRATRRDPTGAKDPTSSSCVGGWCLERRASPDAEEPNADDAGVVLVNRSAPVGFEEPQEDDDTLLERRQQETSPVNATMVNSRTWHGAIPKIDVDYVPDKRSSPTTVSQRNAIYHAGDASTISASSNVSKQLLRAGVDVSAVAVSPVTFRAHKVIHCVSRALRSCAELANTDIRLLRGKMDAIPLEDNSSQGRLYDIEKQMRAAERYLKRIEYHLARMDELKEQYDMQLRIQHGAQNIISAYDGGGGSLGRRKSNDLVKGGMRDVCRAIGRLESELQALMGTLHVELKGVIGFARVTPGDVFEVTVRCGEHKWKTRGKTIGDRSQNWDKNYCILKCRLDEAVDVRICEVKLFGKLKPLSQQQFDPCQFFSAQPQLLTMNLTANGSIKLQLVVTWSPIDASLAASTTDGTGSVRYPPPALTVSAGGSSPHSSLSTGSRSSSAGAGGGIVDVRQGKQVRPTSVFFNGAHSDGKFDSLQRNHSASLVQNVPSRTMKAFSGTLPRVSSTASSPRSTSSDAVVRLLKSVRPLLARNLVQYAQLRALDSAMCRLEFALKRKMFTSSGNLDRLGADDDGESSDDLDNNILINRRQTNGGTFLTEPAHFDAAYDSGFDSFRRQSSSRKDDDSSHHRQPMTSSPIVAPPPAVPHKDRSGPGPIERRFKNMKQKRRQSTGASLDDYLRERGLSPTQTSSVGSSGHSEIDQCLVHHLQRCLVCLQSLCYTDGPLHLKEQELIQKLSDEARTVDYLALLIRSLPDLPNLSHVLSEMEACVEVQDAWLSASVPLRARFVVPADDIRRQMRNCFGRIVAARYPELVDQVLDNVMYQMTDDGEWSPTTVSLFQYVGFFRDRHLATFIESMAHGAWISRGLTSDDDAVVRQVLERLSRVPVAPPLDSVRHIGLLLTSAKRQRQTLAESYLTSCRGELKEDLVRIYFSLLEHSDEATRAGAIRSLVVLNALESALAVAYVADRDRSDLVRREANQALAIFERIMLRRNRNNAKMNGVSPNTETRIGGEAAVEMRKPIRRKAPPPPYRESTKV